MQLLRRHRLKVGIVVLATGALITSLGVVAFSASSQSASTPEGFVGVSPTRVLDTRTPPVGVATAAPVGPGATVNLPLTTTAPNRSGIPVPAGAVSVLLNVTVDSDVTAPSFITVWPAGTQRPTTSVINPKPGTVVSGSILVPLGMGGDVSIFNFAGDANVIVDLAGYTLALSATGGVPGPPGAPGQPGPPGPVGSAGNWGVMNRNTVGSPVAQLRSGPLTPPVGQALPLSPPPFGSGSLNLTVADNEKATYGNEVDFQGQPFALSQVGFQVYNLLENGLNNMPGIAFEINPNVTAFPLDLFSTVTFFPPTSPPGVWSSYLDGTTEGLWGGTGDAFAGTVCDINGSLCTFAQLQTLLDDGGDPATIFTVAITKGTDVAWHGAVDGLRINNTVYDFEEFGVNAVAV